MQIDRILYPITTLGPGERLVIWTIGCSKQCFNCSNPELWKRDPNRDINTNELMDLIMKTLPKEKVEGVTITGGDPLEQIKELNKLLPLLHSITDDILVYTGYPFAALQEKLAKEDFAVLEQYVTVLIDGVYTEDLNDNSCPLRGSSNQQLIYFDDSKKEKYLHYLNNTRSVQNIFYNDKMISVGIPIKEHLIMEVFK